MADPIFSLTRVKSALGGDAYKWLNGFFVKGKFNPSDDALVALINPRTGAEVPLGGATAALKSKILQSIDKNQARPYLTSFLNAPSAWQASTAYVVGNAILAGGNWYCCVTAGTSGASAPTWTTTPQVVAPFYGITDGSCVWVYYSPAQTLTPSDTTVTLSFNTTAHASATNVYTPVTGSWGTPSYYIPDTNANQDNQWNPVGTGTTATLASWVGDLLVSPNSLYVRPLQTGGGALGITSCCANGSATFNGKGGYWEINTDAQIIDLEVAQWDANLFNVVVDGVTVNVGTITTALATGNTSQYARIAITGPIRKRNIKIFGINNMRSVRITGNAQLFKVARTALKVFAMGDSFFAGSGMSGGFGAYWPDYFARELGVPFCCSFAVGGTGIETVNSNYNWVDRLNENGNRTVAAPYNYASLQRKQFDVILVEMGNGNDNPLSATLPAKLLGILQTLRSLQPNALIVGVSIWGNTNETYFQNMNNMAKGVWAQFSDSNSLFVYTAGEDGARWVTGNNRCASGQVGATGNSSLMIGYDGVHPMDNTNVFLGQKTAQAVFDYLGLTQ